MSRATNLFLTRAVLASTIFVTPLAQATVFSGGTFPGPYPVITSTNGNVVQVAPSGQLSTAGTDTVQVDSSASQVIIEPGNFTFGINAIKNAGAFQAIHILPGSVNTSVTVGQVGGIHNTGAGDALEVGTPAAVAAASTTINNKGTIQADNALAIELQTLGSAIVNNATGGLVNGVLTEAIFTQPTAGLLTLNNSGTVQGQGASSAMTLNATAGFTAINNNIGGIIQETNGGGGNAITISAGSQGVINNSGRIFSQAKSAIELTGAAATKITGIHNLSGATIESQALTTILTSGPVNVGVINNAGTISNNANNNAIDISLATSGTVNQTAGAINGDVRLAPLANGGALGTLNSTFSLSGGAIGGNVIAATNANAATKNLLSLTGGTITATAALGNNGDTVNLAGSALNILNGGAGVDIYNLTAGGFNLLDGIGGADVVNVNASFTQTGLMRNTGGTLTLNINNAGTVFTSKNNILNVNGVNVNAGTRMILQPLIQMVGGNFNVNAGGILEVANGFNEVIDFTADPGGILANSGTVILQQNSTLSLIAPAGGTAGLFTNNAGSSFNPQLRGVVTLGDAPVTSTLIVNDIAGGSVNLKANSFIAPSFVGFMPDNANFTVVAVNPEGVSTIIDNSTLLQPPSATVFFTKALDVGAEHLILTSHRNPFTAFFTDSNSSLAALLDRFTIAPPDQNALNLLIQLDSISHVEGLQNAIESLAPDVSGAKFLSSIVGLNNVFEGVSDRMVAFSRGIAYNRFATQEAKRNYPFYSEKEKEILNSSLRVASNGLNFGDPAGSWTGWGRVFGAHLNASQTNVSQGFKANGVGGVLGFDYGLSDCITLGLAGSYAHVDSDGKQVYAKDVAVKSWQGTLYGLFDFRYGIFADAMVAYAHNDYDSDRAIHVGAIQGNAQADFSGNLFGAQGDLGWKTLYHCAYVAPFARLKYAYLYVNDYVEEGPSFLNLHVSGESVDEFLGGLGVKLGASIPWGRTLWVPELTLLGSYDFANDSENVTSNFIGITGTPSFQTVGADFGRGVFNLGLGLNTHLLQSTVLSVKYDLEVREDFISNAGYLQVMFACF